MAEENRELKEKFALRLPEGMLTKLKIAAEENRRSMNAEIIARLEASFQVEKRGGLSWLKNVRSAGPEIQQERIESLEAHIKTVEEKGLDALNSLIERVAKLELERRKSGNK